MQIHSMLGYSPSLHLRCVNGCASPSSALHRYYSNLHNLIARPTNQKNISFRKLNSNKEFLEIKKIVTYHTSVI